MMTYRSRTLLLLLREFVLIVSLFIDLILFCQLVDSHYLAHLVLATLVDNSSKAPGNDLLEMIIWVIKPLHHLISGDLDSLAIFHRSKLKFISSLCLFLQL